MDLNELKGNLKEIIGIKQDTNTTYSEYIKGKNYTESVVYPKVKVALNSLNTNYCNCVILKGESGIGKSESVNQWLKETETDFKIISGYTTQAYLFDFLAENHNKLIIFRDTDILTKNLNILKAITESPNIVYRMTKTQVNTSFRFDGRIIIELNNLPKLNTDLVAVLNRVILLDLAIPENLKIEFIESIAKDKELFKEYISLSPKPALREYLRIEANPELLKLIPYETEPERKFLSQIIGTEWIKPTRLKERLQLEGYKPSRKMSERKIKEWLEVGILETEGIQKRNDRVRLKNKGSD